MKDYWTDDRLPGGVDHRPHDHQLRRERQGPGRAAAADRAVTGSAMGELLKGLEEGFAAEGYRFTVVPASRVDDLRRDMEEALARGQVDPAVYSRYVEPLVNAPPVAGARALIVVAAPSPPVTVVFHLDGAEGGRFEAVIPPTYIFAAIRARCLEVLRGVLEPPGCWVERARVPFKLLAARSRLVEQGRNNLSYVRGLGSHLRLEAFFTDADLLAGFRARPKVRGTVPPHDRWGLPARIGGCSVCSQCRASCPTGCIPHDGTTIDQGRCLTYLNENEGEWPEWLDPSAHNALVGCMRCQEKCPVNWGLSRRGEIVAEFDKEETGSLLNGLPVEGLPASVKAKLEALDDVGTACRSSDGTFGACCDAAAIAKARAAQPEKSQAEAEPAEAAPADLPLRGE